MDIVRAGFSGYLESWTVESYVIDLEWSLPDFNRDALSRHGYRLDPKEL